jgi:hypothetical protein
VNKIRLEVFITMLFLPTLAAQSRSEIRGIALDAHRQQALPNIEVQLVGTEYRATTDASGHFRIAPIAPGDYVLNASAMGYWPVTTPFHLGSDEIKDFELIFNNDAQRRSDTASVQSGSVFELPREDAPAHFSVTGNDIKNLGTLLAQDPLRAVQGFPGISSNDDFEARFSLHGADFSRIGVYLDGILLHEPLHTVQTMGRSGSSSAISGDLVEQLDLYDAAYPVRYGGRSAGVLDMHLRDGPRDHYSFRLSASFANAGAIAEGPLGKFNRCAWTGSVRKSYLQYILDRTLTHAPPTFGLDDAQGRLSCNLTPKSHVSLDVIESFTDLDRSGVARKLGVNSLMLASHRFAFANLAWQYIPNEKLLITTRGAWMGEKFDDRNPNQKPLGTGRYREGVWDSNLTWMWNSRNPLDVGVNLRVLREVGYGEQYSSPALGRVLAAYNGSGTLTGGFLQQSWGARNGRVSLSAGGRWDHHSLDSLTTFSPQASLSLSPTSSLRLQLGWGQYVQYPEIRQMALSLGSRGLLPVRSAHAIAAVEQRLGERVRVRGEFYDRQDRDLLDQPWFDPRIVKGKAFVAGGNWLYENSLRGYARGVEISLRRVSANGLTGWVSYAYGRTGMRDGITNLSFPSDWDQRHTINAYGSYRVRPTVNVSLRWGYGSGFPVPGFLQRDGSVYFLSSDRNRLRLGPYQRLDFRINKSWTHVHWKATLYGEVLNLTNKANYRFDSFNGYNTRTGQAFLTLDRLFPILPSLGLVIER